MIIRMSIKTTEKMPTGEIDLARQRAKEVSRDEGQPEKQPAKTSRVRITSPYRSKGMFYLGSMVMNLRHVSLRVLNDPYGRRVCR